MRPECIDVSTNRNGHRTWRNNSDSSGWLFWVNGFGKIHVHVLYKKWDVGAGGRLLDWVEITRYNNAHCSVYYGRIENSLRLAEALATEMDREA